MVRPFEDMLISQAGIVLDGLKSDRPVGLSENLA